MLRLKNQQDTASRANIAKTSKLIYEYENIVVGSSLTAALFAFKNGYPMVFTEVDRPFRFDFLEPNNIYENLKIPATSKEINTFSGVKQVGVPKEILWERLMFLLSMDSKIPLSNLCNSIRNIDGTIGSPGDGVGSIIIRPATWFGTGARSTIASATGRNPGNQTGQRAFLVT